MKRDAKSKKGPRLKKRDGLTKLCVRTARKSSGDVENGRVESTSSRILSRVKTRDHFLLSGLGQEES